MPELEGRRLWLAGIGGAGFSAYAVVAKAWGAEVSGWDRNETPYLAHVREAGIPVTVSDEPPAPPADAEAYVSTAYAGRVPAEAERSCSPSSWRSAARSSSRARTARRRPPR